MIHALLILLALLLPSLSHASSTLSWDCNPPAGPGVAETKDFTVQKTIDGVTTTLGTVPQPVPCTGKLTLIDPVDIPAGKSAIYSVWANSPTGIKSAVVTVTKTVALPPIGPMTVMLGKITDTSITFTYTLPTNTKPSIRIMVVGQNWGQGTVVECPASPCTATGLTPGTKYELGAIPYEGVLGQNPRYGTFIANLPFVTVATIPPTPTGFTVADAIKEANLRCDKLKSCSFATWRSYLKEAMKKVTA